MALDLYVDLDGKAFVAGANTTAALSSLDFFYGDTVDINLQFLKSTGNIQSPYSSVDYSDKSVTLSIGSVLSGAAITQSTWSNVTSSGGSVTVTSAGSSTSDSIQQINISGNKGIYTLTIPSRSGSFVPAGSVFSSPIPHGLLIGTAITISYTGGTIASFSSDTSFSGTFYVATIPTSKTFTLADANGTTYSPAFTGTLGDFTGSWTIPSLTTYGIDVSASSTQVQTALAALVDTSNVVVGGSNGVFTIHFVNKLANVQMPTLVLSANVSSVPFKNSSINFTGTALQHAIASGNVIMEVAVSQNGFSTTVAQIPIHILGSVQNGNGTSSVGVTNSAKIPFPSMVLGADYSFGILPRDGITKQPIDLTNASLAATMHTGPIGPQIASMNVTMPLTLGDSIICILPAAQTAGISVSDNNSYFWIKLLLTNSDGSVTPLGSGFVQVNPS
jgi:hypothetical protein